MLFDELCFTMSFFKNFYSFKISMSVMIGPLVNTHFWITSLFMCYSLMDFFSRRAFLELLKENSFL